MSLANQVATNTISQVVGRIVTTALSLVTVSVLNSSLGPERWGLLSSVTLFGTFFAVAADMGLTTYYLREGSRLTGGRGALTTKVVTFRVLTAAVLLALAPLIAMAIPAYHQLVLPVALISLGQFVLLLNQVFVSIFQLELAMARASFGDAVGRTLILILTLLVVRSAAPESQLVLASTAVLCGGILNLAISFLLSRRYVKLSFGITYADFKKLLRDVSPLAILAVLTVLHFKVDSFLLVLLRNPVEVGIYANSYKIMEILLVLPSMFVGSLFPAFAEALDTKKERLSHLFETAAGLLLWSVLPIVVLVSLFAPYIMAVLTRVNIFEAAGALQVLSLALFAWFIGSLLSHILVVARKQKLLVQVKLTMLALNLVANLVVIPQYGYMGAAWVTVATETLSAFVLLVLAGTQLQLKLPLKKYLPMLTLAVCFGVALYLLKGALDRVLLERFLEISRSLQGLFVVSLGAMVVVSYLFLGKLTNSLPQQLVAWMGRIESR